MVRSPVLLLMALVAVALILGATLELVVVLLPFDWSSTAAAAVDAAGVVDVVALP